MDVKKELYDATYATMITRIHENGYSPTSLTGAYSGMFVRDASIQTLAHIANGDFDMAKRILQYIVSYHKATGAAFASHIIRCLPEECTEQYSMESSTAKAFATNGITLSQKLSPSFNSVYVCCADLILSHPDEDDGKTYTVSLFKGDTEVDAITRPISEIGAKKERVHFNFCLPLSDITAEKNWYLSLTTSSKSKIFWHGVALSPENELSSAAYDGSALPLMLSHSIGWIDTFLPCDSHVQIDGNYQLINAFTEFATKSGEEYKTFIDKIYPIIAQYALYFIEKENGYVKENGLLLTPCLEHSRGGCYWEATDLITNCFAAEALRKMANLANAKNDKENAKKFARASDSISQAINKHLVTEIDGKPIYAEMIAHKQYTVAGETKWIGEKLYKGFSWINLAPIASGWNAADSETVKNTYNAYLKYCSDLYTVSDKSYKMLDACCQIDENSRVVSYGNHVIGKGLAWELYYLYKINDKARLSDMLDFIETNSDLTYPESYWKSGELSDSANQEQASWLIYEIARIIGIYKTDL